MDVLLKHLLQYVKRCNKHPKFIRKLKNISAQNYGADEIYKLLYSVGSFAVLANQTRSFKDIIPYKLCEFQRKASKGEDLFSIEQKAIHTTQLVDYVLDSLARVNKKMTLDKIDDLSTIIGEILINAEEHSSLNKRYSIGYFQEFQNKESHFGIFKLAIFNFGQTIYEKFKDPNCPNKMVVSHMQELSHDYVGKRLFSPSFEEETLWTLYSLQEGVTSTSPARFKKRGNGSIRFIESFFNIKGTEAKKDDISQFAILSGNTSIIFDGTYQIVDKLKGAEKFKIMAFNKEGDISKKPDEKFVKFVRNYFPGTIINANILIAKDDVI